jgi:arginase family enzyme
LRHAESRIATFEDLAGSYDEFMREAISMLRMPPDYRQSNRKLYRKSVDDLRAAVRKASLHMPEELRQALYETIALAAEAVTANMASDALADNDERVLDLANRRGFFVQAHSGTASR